MEPVESILYNARWFNDLTATELVYIGAHAERLRHDSSDSYKCLLAGCQILDQLCRGVVQVTAVKPADDDV